MKRGNWAVASFSALLMTMVVVCHLYRASFVSGPFDPFRPLQPVVAGFAFVPGCLYRDGAESRPVRYAAGRVSRTIVPQPLIDAAFALSSLFGAVAAVTPLFGSWDAGAYLSSGAYRYLPHGIPQLSLLYVVFAIGFRSRCRWYGLGYGGAYDKFFGGIGAFKRSWLK